MRELLLSLKSRFATKGPITLEQLLMLPNVVTVSEERMPTEQLQKPLLDAAEGALEALVRTRQREGRRLVQDLRSQAAGIERCVRAIQRRIPRSTKEQEKYLRQRLTQLLGNKTGVLRSQLQEAGTLVREVDVHEEIVRIGSHISHIRQVLANGGEGGRQLDFIAQELTRETNTLGAKANDAEAARFVVEIKGRIEKLREQAQNVE
jgi:uncharacterized protein (TIGR00255 family)